MSQIVLQQDFYAQNVVEVARQLLGKVVFRRTQQGLTTGRIVETEAYLHDGDPACHGFKGLKNSNAAMFGNPGRAYVYPIHGKWCFNAVAQAKGESTAVLIRSLEPLEGVKLMTDRRKHFGAIDQRKITTGPSRLCQALAIDRALDFHNLSLGNRLWIEDDGFKLRVDQILLTQRIGVTSAKDFELRFVIRENKFVSGPIKMRS